MKKCVGRCCAWVQKRVCHHRGVNSRPSTQCTDLQKSIAKTTQLSRFPLLLQTSYLGRGYSLGMELFSSRR